MDVAIAPPDAYQPDKSVLDFAKSYGNKLLVTSDIAKAAKDADVLYTDVWASMGMEAEVEKRNRAFKDFQINAEVMKYAKPDAMVQHCLPAKRGQEITDEVLEAHANEIFDEAENRLHAQKAVMVKLMA
jgi:ornithine carbamoyltransferase